MASDPLNTQSSCLRSTKQSYREARSGGKRTDDEVERNGGSSRSYGQTMQSLVQIMLLLRSLPRIRALGRIDAPSGCWSHRHGLRFFRFPKPLIACHVMCKLYICKLPAFVDLWGNGHDSMVIPIDLGLLYFQSYNEY